MTNKSTETRFNSLLEICDTQLKKKQEHSLLHNSDKEVHHALIPDVALLRCIQDKFKHMQQHKSKAFLGPDLLYNYHQEVKSIYEMLNKRDDVCEAITFKKELRWVLRSINEKCPGIFETHISKNTKEGTVLIMKGQDYLDILHSVLNPNRNEAHRNEKTISNLNEDVVKLKKEVDVDLNFKTILLKVAKKLNSENICAQCIKNVLQYSGNPKLLSTINLNDLLQEMDPVVWNFMVILTLQKSELSDLQDFDWDTHYTDFMKAGSAYEHRRFVESSKLE